MSTKMTDTDWANALEVFRACLPRRGRKAADDRLFLEAMHFFTVENVRWRALPERFGHWNSVWKRFDRLSKAGVFEAFFDTLAEMSASAHLIQMSIYTSIWDSGTLREKVTLQLRLRARESQLKCNVWRLCERCFLFQGRLPGFDAFIGDALDTVLDRLDCEFV